MGSIDIRPGSSADKFTVIKTSSDGAHMEFLTRAALEERLEKEWWGTDPKFSPPPAVPPVRMNEADFSVVCHERRPSCPMLCDDVWYVVWGRARAAGAPEGRVKLHRGPAQRERQLLCMECAERMLGREMILDDLEDCIGNLAIRLWVGRLLPVDTTDSVRTVCP